MRMTFQLQGFRNRKPCKSQWCEWPSDYKVSKIGNLVNHNDANDLPITRFPKSETL